MKSSYRPCADQGLSLGFHYPFSKKHWKHQLLYPLPTQVTQTLQLQAPPEPRAGAGTQLSSTLPASTGWEQPPPTPLTAKPTPGAAQGVGTWLEESYQFVWCNQQHCHVHTDTNVQTSAAFDGWADGRQVIKSIWLENHCHFQLKIAPANSYHNFVLFSAKLEYQSKWWCVLSWGDLPKYSVTQR